MKMVKFYLNLSIFTVFLKNINLISKISRSKVTDYAALTFLSGVKVKTECFCRLEDFFYYKTCVKTQVNVQPKQLHKLLSHKIYIK